MYIQKAFKNGNSVVVTLPREYMRELNIRDGSEIVVTKLPNGLFFAPKKAPNKRKKIGEEGVSKEFRKWLDEALKEDAQILDELAER